jgi:hypothetical protein
MPERTSRSADADRDHQKTEADCVSYRPSKFQITASAAISSTNMMMRRPMWFTRHHPFFVVRVREAAPQSPFALVSAQPHPKAAAQGQRDIVARRRAPLPWRACDGTRQAICECLRVVRRSWASRLGRSPGIYRNLLVPRQQSCAFQAPFHGENIAASAVSFDRSGRCAKQRLIHSSHMNIRGPATRPCLQRCIAQASADSSNMKRVSTSPRPCTIDTIMHDA